MRTPRIVIEQFPNELIREFHVNEPISTQKLFDSVSGLESLEKFAVGQYESATIDVARSFYEVEGVTSVSLDIYEVRITIGRAFDWDDIITEVVNRIEKRLSWVDAEILHHDSRVKYGSGYGLATSFGDYDYDSSSEGVESESDSLLDDVNPDTPDRDGE